MMTNPDDGASQTGEQRYRHLLDHAPICIFVIDLTVTPATILEANRRAELVYGYPAAGMVGAPAAALTPEEAVPTVLTIAQQVKAGQTVTVETTNRRRDGTRFPVRVIASPDPAEDGQMIVMVEDITAQAQRREVAAAIEADRRRIAHEIHDGVAQSLAGLRFKSAFWSHLAATAPPNMRAALDELQIVLMDGITELRRAIFALRPLDLDELGFFPALTQLVADFGEQNQLVAVLEISGSPDALPAAYELTVFRIIQEGLNNISQHANASSVLVRLTMDLTGSVLLAVRDNGRGFDPHQLGPTDHSGHFGLHQMRERILDQGGTLDIESGIGQGTTLVITMPPRVQEVAHATN